MHLSREAGQFDIRIIEQVLLVYIAADIRDSPACSLYVVVQCVIEDVDARAAGRRAARPHSIGRPAGR